MKYRNQLSGENKTDGLLYSIWKEFSKLSDIITFLSTYVSSISNGGVINVNQTINTNLVNHIFNGTTATWVLPAVASIDQWTTIYIKNRGSGTLTVNATAAANEIFTTSAVNTLSITSGSSAMLVNDGTYYNIL
jgi:hypothetical protein